jgi:opacity protein-like surface antigen
MKKVLLSTAALIALATAGPAFSADLGLIKALPYASPAWSWSGLYVGGHIGGGWSWKQWQNADGWFGPTGPFGGAFSPFISEGGGGGGGVAGGQIGYNVQAASWVFGLEVDASWADIDGTARCAAATFLCNARVDSLGTIAGRLGYAGIDRLLLYMKGGAAWAHDKFRMSAPPLLNNNIVSFAAPNVFMANDIRWGWALGAGIEYAFASDWSAFLEYDYLGLGSRTIAFTDQIGNASNISIRQDVYLVKVGVNHSFGWPAPASAFGLPVPAADRGRAYAVAAPATGWSWTGIYVGGHAGGSWGVKDWNNDPSGFFSGLLPFGGTGNVDGLAFGGQVGAKYQIGRWVIGAEAAASWADLDGNAECATIALGAGAESFTCNNKVDSLWSLTGRLGQAYGNVLLYGAAGFGWAHEKYDMISPPAAPNHFTAQETRPGYVLGSGVEIALPAGWSATVEYNYFGLGTRTLTFVDLLGNRAPIGIEEHLHLVKLGMNYRFGAADLPAAVAAYGGKRAIYKAPSLLPISDWSMGVGARSWFSSGRTQLDLYSNVLPTRLNSRLIYGGLQAYSNEAFARFDHRSGVFVKGNLGMGDIHTGTLNDEDFPPEGDPIYSNSQHEIKDSRMRYAGADVGYNFLNWADGKAGLFTGYRYVYQRVNGFGCQNIGTYPLTCSATPFAPAPFPTLSLTETETWQAAALGLNTQVTLWPRVMLEVDAAYLPYANRDGTDNHWNRPDINPQPESGHGWGAQFEAVLSYAVTDRFSVGVGGRYWYFTTTDAHTQFPSSPTLSPLKFYMERYGSFLQASYKFDEGDVLAAGTLPAKKASPMMPARSWTGTYVGIHLGAGWGRNNWSDPFPPVSGLGDRVDIGGALAGGQIGFNYQIGFAVWGLEADAAWANIQGTNTCFPGFPGGIFEIAATGAEFAGGTGFNCGATIHALGTVAGRLGYAIDRTLVYVKAGGAGANESYNLNLVAGPGPAGLGLGIANTSVTRWGWTVGGGVEHAIGSDWTTKLEYNYIDLGSAAVALAFPPPFNSFGVTDRIHVVKLGLNYRFDWSALVVK